MCGIFFGKKEKAFPIYQIQEKRGTEGVGIIAPNIGIKKIYENVLGRRDDAYEKFLKTLKIPPHQNIIMHHRKASHGSAGIDNTHPFTGKKFFMMQNGTSSAVFHIARYIDVQTSATDTETLLNIIEQNCNTLKEAALFLDRISVIDKGVGIIFLVDRRTAEILFYSDGARESFIRMKKKKKQHIRQITNVDQDKEYDHKNIGWIIFKFNGEIIEKDILLNIKTKKAEPVKNKDWRGYDYNSKKKNGDEDYSRTGDYNNSMSEEERCYKRLGDYYDWY